MVTFQNHPVTGEGTAPRQEGQIPTLMLISLSASLIVRHSSAINHSISSVTHTAWSTPVIPIWNLLGAISIDELGKKKKKS